MSLLKFFWKNIFSDQSFNWFTIICTSLGIYGLLLVESFKLGVEDKVNLNAKNFIASDLSISTRREFTPKEQNIIETYINTKHFQYTRWVETYSLVSNNKGLSAQSKLANLNFVSENFPFYGDVSLENNSSNKQTPWSDLHSSPHAWISRDLSWQLGLTNGDSIRIGEQNFFISGIILSDKFSSFRGFNLAPKIFVSYKYLKNTELIKFGSTGFHSYNLKIPNNKETPQTKIEIRKMLPDLSIKINGPEDSSKQISRALRLLGDYLSLVTLISYLLSLTGLFYFTQNYLSKRIKVFSIYKSMGIKNVFIFKTNILHLFALTSSAVIISMFFSLITLPFLQTFFSNLSGETLYFRLSHLSFLKVLIFSIAGSILALGPLFWGALQTPSGVIFHDLPTNLKRIKYTYFIPLFFYIIILTFLLANSLKLASYFILSLLILCIIGSFIFKLITLLLERFSEHFNIINKNAARSLSRYFTSSFTIFISLLIGLTLTIFIVQLESSLKNEFSQSNESKRPDLFMFDLQDYQLEKFQTFIENEKISQTMLSPMIRARLLRINNDSVQKDEPQTATNFETREDETNQNMRNRGVNLSYRPTLSWSERIIEGTYNGGPCLPEIKTCEISLDKNYANRLGVKLGDTLFFDVSGMEIKGIVTSFRLVKWTSFEPNFFILFQPGLLEDAPKTYLTSFKIQTPEEKRRIFTNIAKDFPNVSIIEVSDLLNKIFSIFDLMSMAIKVIATLSLCVSLIVLTAVSYNHLELRKNEMSLFYLIGFKLNIIKSIYTRELTTIIIISLALSLLFGSFFTMTLMKIIFDAQAILQIPYCLALTTVIGILLYFIVFLRVRSLTQRKNMNI